MLIFLHSTYRMHHSEILTLREKLFVRDSRDPITSGAWEHGAIYCLVSRVSTGAADVLVAAAAAEATGTFVPELASIVRCLASAWTTDRSISTKNRTLRPY
jgi:hypothetical protein